MSSLISELPKPSTASPKLYNRDTFTWAKQQADALRRRDLQAIDWENVIEEIESVGRAERANWVGNCAPALQHMLLVEHWKAVTRADAKGWRREIRAFRLGMAAAIRTNRGLQGEYVEMLADAWADGRARAVDRLAEYSAKGAGAEDDRRFRRAVDAQLPEDCPYLVEHVNPYDPKVDKQPRDDVWPPAVAIVFNRLLGTDYEILQGPSRKPPWERGRSR